MRIRKIGLLSASMAVLLAVSGCASANEGGQAGPAIFVEGVGTNPPHLNGQLTTDGTVSQVSRAVFESLVGQDASFNIVPELAESWDVSEDGLQWTFHIREGVAWHDGEPFTAADVKYNIDEVVPLNPLGTQLTDNVASVEVVDDFTAIVSLAKPFAPVLEALTSQVMIPKHLYEGTDITSNPANLAPIGTGPYKFTEFVAGDRIVVDKYDKYWGRSGDAEQIIFKIIADNNARMLALRAGDIDFTSSSYTDQTQIAALDSNEFFVMTSQAAPSMTTVFFNTDREIFSDVRMRHAILSALDREVIAADAFSGSAVAARGPIPAGFEWAVDPDVNFLEEVPFDRAGAQSQLDALGYPVGSDGIRFSIELNYPSGWPTFASTAELIKSQLEEVGIRVNLVQEDFNVWADTTFKQHDFDMDVFAAAAYADPNMGVSRLYVCNADDIAFRNPSGVCDPALDEAFAKAASVADRDERAVHFAEAEKRAAELLHAFPIAEERPRGVIREDRWTNLEEFAESMTTVDYTALTLK